MTPHQQLTNILVAADCHIIQSVYTGIGSRKTPDDILDLMTRIAVVMDARGWTLRSGAADRADEAFDRCVQRAEIYLPWPHFEQNEKRRHPLPADSPEFIVRPQPTPMAEEIAARFHPMWHKVKRGGQKLHARNVHQILGMDCKSPSAMVVCWTPDGSTGITTPETGGTGQALRIALHHGVPIFNLQRKDHREAWEEVIL